MKEELDEKLCERFPTIFRDRYGDERNTGMCWGFECGDGWFQLLWDLCKTIVKADPQGRVVASRVKEKLAGLRFYWYTHFTDEEYASAIGSGIKLDPGFTRDVDALVNFAERKSYHICEMCGKAGMTRSTGGWIYSMCDECFTNFLSE